MFGNDLKRFLSRDLKSMSRYYQKKNHIGLISEQETLHQNKIDYSLNTHLYRTKEFILNEEVLALGCSQTFGFGLHKNQSWPELVSLYSSKSVTNLSTPGDSAQGQVLKAFKYMQKYGNPKIIIGVFPAARLEFIQVRKSWSDQNEDHLENFRVFTVDLASLDKKIESIVKKPYDPNKIFTGEIAQFYTHMFIDILEQYCESNGIKFMYTIWDPYYQSDEFIEIMTNHSKNYFIVKDICEPMPSECHKDLSGYDFFNKAADFVDDISPSHWSFHRQIHVSESVIEKINEPL